MCICFFCISKNQADHYRFVLAFNREEFSNRETKPLESFEEDANLLAGRDLKEKGTWLGINKKTGNIAYLTNYSDWRVIFSWGHRKNMVSRGKILYDFLKSDFYSAIPEESARSPGGEEQGLAAMRNYAQKVVDNLQMFNPFNLVIGNVRSGNFFYVGNFPESMSFFPIEPGLYTMCSMRQFEKGTTKKQDFGLLEFGKAISESGAAPPSKISGSLRDKVMDVMMNKTKFDKGPLTEGSLFLPMYFNLIFWKYRQTKTTTLLTVDKSMRVDILERTYTGYLEKDAQKPVFSDKFVDFYFV